MRGFYLLDKSVMAKFKKGDVVTTLQPDNNDCDKSVIWIDAVVDFQDWDSVYISEWWKNLSNPIRYIVPSNILYLKNWGKLEIKLAEINALMASVLKIQNANYNIEPDINNMQVWDTFYNENQKYTYVWTLDWQVVRDKEWYFCIIDEEDIKKLFWTKFKIWKK